MVGYFAAHRCFGSPGYYRLVRDGAVGLLVGWQCVTTRCRHRSARGRRATGGRAATPLARPGPPRRYAPTRNRHAPWRAEAVPQQRQSSEALPRRVAGLCAEATLRQRLTPTLARTRRPRRQAAQTRGIADQRATIRRTRPRPRRDHEPPPQTHHRPQTITRTMTAPATRTPDPARQRRPTSSPR